MLSVVLPDSLMVRLLGDPLSLLVRVNHILFRDHFRVHLAHFKMFLEESLSSLGSSGVHTKHNSFVLISSLETVEIDVFRWLCGLVSHPVCGVGHFVIEQSCAHSFAEVFESEPVEHIRGESISHKLHGSGFCLHVVHGIIPSLTRVVIDFPAVSWLTSGPVWHSETFEESSWLSIEPDVSDSLEEGARMEVLSINVELNIGFFEKLLVVEVFNSHAYIIILN